jgi:hypothetical protein
MEASDLSTSTEGFRLSANASRVPPNSKREEKKMKLRIRFVIFVLVLAATSGMIVPYLNAESCKNADLHGQYSFVASGTVNGQPYATAGQTIYHGDGTAEGVIQVSLGGNVLPVATWTATYTASPMATNSGATVCVITKAITIPAYGGLVVNFFITAGADFKQLRFIATDAGTTVSGTATKE